MSEKRRRYDSEALAHKLRDLLMFDTPSTQQKICNKLAKHGFEVNQSTVSRLLRRLQAIKTTDARGRTVYRLPAGLVLPGQGGSIGNLVRSVQSNGTMVVISTAPGSASVVAQYLDQQRPPHIMGTLAGDDTLFVAPSTSRVLPSTLDAIRRALGVGETAA